MGQIAANRPKCNSALEAAVGCLSANDLDEDICSKYLYALEQCSRYEQIKPSTMQFDRFKQIMVSELRRISSGSKG